MLTGSIRLQNELRNLGDGEQFAETRLVNYGLRFHPLQALSLSLSASDYWAYMLGNLDSENRSLLTQFNGRMLPTLNMGMQAGYSMNRQPVADRLFETWNYSVSLDGEVTPRIGAMVSHAYRVSRERNSGMRNSQNRANGNLTLRLTNTLYMRAEADMALDGGYHLAHRYNFNWRPLSRLNFGAQAYLSNRGESQGRGRYAFYGNYEFSRSGNFYFRQSRNSSTALDPQETVSTQIGIKMAF